MQDIVLLNLEPDTTTHVCEQAYCWASSHVTVNPPDPPDLFPVNVNIDVNIGNSSLASSVG